MVAALTGLGLSAAAGLNAFIPLVVVACFARFTDVMHLPASIDWLGSWPVIIISLGLLAVETVLDKIPGVDHVNDLLQTLVRPFVGALLFAATAGADVFAPSAFFAANPWVGAGIGLVVAFATHVAKATTRPSINAATSGTGSPIASVVEDTAAIFLCLSALFFPFLVPLLILAIGGATYWVVTMGRRRRHKRAEREQALIEERAQRDRIGWRDSAAQRELQKLIKRARKLRMRR